MAYPLTCESGHVDHLDEAARAHQAALAGVPRAEARAKEIIAAARAKVTETRTALAVAIVAEYEGGARVGDLAARAGYSRETVRRILRAAGIEPD